MPNAQFPPGLHSELTLALLSYASSRDAGDVDRLKTVSEKVCRYARSAGMTPESMIIGLKRAYETVESAQPQKRERLRAVYENLLRECLTAYFDDANNVQA